MFKYLHPFLLTYVFPPQSFLWFILSLQQYQLCFSMTVKQFYFLTYDYFKIAILPWVVNFLFEVYQSYSFASLIELEFLRYMFFYRSQYFYIFFISLNILLKVSFNHHHLDSYFLSFLSFMKIILILVYYLNF